MVIYSDIGNTKKKAVTAILLSCPELPLAVRNFPCPELPDLTLYN